MNADSKQPVPRGTYILHAVGRYTLNGDAYIRMEDIYRLCKEERKGLTYQVFQDDLAELFHRGKLIREGRRLYSARILRYENSASEYLAKMILNNRLPGTFVPGSLDVDGLTLLPEQRNAVEMALNHRISIVLGGAGSGKTTLIQAIAQQHGNQIARVLTAPTGKAARNLTNRTGMEARTVHSALGMKPDDDFLIPVVWRFVDLVIVDEASMMTLEMLAGFLCKMKPDCRLVLLGDPNQLLSVGSGNVLPDLLKLGVPYIRLEHNHRQADAGLGLQRNVVDFTHHSDIRSLVFDESFMLKELGERGIKAALVEEAVRRYRNGERVQVLSPYNRVTELSVEKLNCAIQPLVNPAEEGKRELYFEGKRFRNGDRVIITKNDREQDCYNGDVGILYILIDDKEHPMYAVELPDGRCPLWLNYEGLSNMALAYAITVHKAQGGEFDTVLMPVANSFMNMMYRNLLYTAISRARKQVILYGSPNALGAAIQTPAQERASMLVVKTHQAMYRCA